MSLVGRDPHLLSDVAESPSHQNARRHSQRSSSWSTSSARDAPNPFFHSRSHQNIQTFPRRRKQRQSFTADDLLSSNEIRKELGLPPKSRRDNTIGKSLEGAQESQDRSHRRVAPETPDSGGRRTKRNEDSESLMEPDPAQSHLHASTSRRGHVRTVSKDDYLLARGANPRTGVVMPGFHSSESSIDDTVPLRERRNNAPAKWRQNGEQWISLDVDQLTPGADPSLRARLARHGRPLQAPPKLSAIKYSQNDFSHTNEDGDVFGGERLARTPALKRPSDQYRTDFEPKLQKAEHYTNVPAETEHIRLPGVSGSKTYGPSRMLPYSGQSQNVIRRKPVGSPPSKSTVANSSERLRFPLPSAKSDTIFGHDFEKARSASAPTPRNRRSDSNEVPAAPIEDKVDPAQQNRLGALDYPFLEYYPAGRNVRQYHSSASERHDKELPCLPMNNIPSQLQPLPVPYFKALSSPGALQMSHPSLPARQELFGPHEGDPTYLLLHSQRPTMPPRSYKMPHLVETQIHQPIEYRSHRARISGPRPVRARNLTGVSDSSLEIFTTPPSTISTSTSTPILTSIKQSSNTRHYTALRSETSPLALTRTRPHTESRPLTPSTVEETHGVSQVCLQQHLWKTNGTSDNETSERREQEPRLMPNPLKPSLASTHQIGTHVQEDREIATARGDPAQSCLRRKGSCCHGNSFDHQPHNMLGCILTSETPGKPNFGIDENTDPAGLQQQTPTGATISVLYEYVCSTDNNSDEHIEPSHKNGAESRQRKGSPASPSSVHRKRSFVKHALRNLPPFKQNARAPLTNTLTVKRRRTPKVQTLLAEDTSSDEASGMIADSVFGPVSPGAMAAARAAMTPARALMAPNVKFDMASSPELPAEIPTKRTVSGASTASVRTIDIPTLESVSAVLWSLTIPLGALRMWIKQHPQVVSLGHHVLMRGIEMACCVLDTAGKVYRVSYVYSKTGRLNVAKVGGPGVLAQECIRSVVYVFVFTAALVLFGRVLSLLVGIGSWIGWAGVMIWWVVGRLLGMGLFW